MQDGGLHDHLGPAEAKDDGGDVQARHRLADLRTCDRDVEAGDELGAVGRVDRVVDPVRENGAAGTGGAREQITEQVTELAAEAVAWYGLPFQPAALDPYSQEKSIGPAAGVTAMPSYLNERAATIYSGASEIQRDVLAKRVLGL